MIDIAYAAGETSTVGNLTTFIPLILILVIFWFLIMRPQQKRYKEHQKTISELKRGDKVITNAGIIGKITKVSDHTFGVEIAENVEIQIEKNAVSNRYDPTAQTPVEKK